MASVVNGSRDVVINKMTDESDRHPGSAKDSIELKYGLSFVFASIVFFQILNHWLKTRGPPKTLKPKYDEWKWRNTTVSWVHGCIASIWSVLCMVLYTDQFGDMVNNFSIPMYFCVCFVVGYFWHDFIDLAVNGKLITHWEVTAHHLLVNGMFTWNVFLRSYIPFTIVGIFVEGNSTFLHHRKLLQMVGTPYDSFKYVLVKHLNFVTYIVCRIGALIVITVGEYFYFGILPWQYMLSVTTATTAINMLNFVLLYRLVKSDLLMGAHGERISWRQGMSRDLAILTGQWEKDRKTLLTNGQHGGGAINNNSGLYKAGKED